MKQLEIVFSEVTEYWTGLGWLVIDQDDKPCLASFATKSEAEQFSDECEQVAN